MSEPLPGILSEIAGLVGEAAALAIAARVGGTRVYLPARVGDDHWLVECVGRAKAEQICAHFAVDGRGQRIDIPLVVGGAYQQLRRAVTRRVHELDAENRSAKEIARTVGITMRSVHRQRAAHRGRKTDDGQGSLF